MRLSIQSSYFAGQSPAGAVRMARQAGYAAIEWAAASSETDHAMCDERFDASRHAGIEVSGVCQGSLPGNGLAEPDQTLRAAAMEAVRTGLEAASKFGASSLVIRPATFGADTDYQAAYWGVLEGVGKLRFDAQRRAVRIVLDMAGSGLASSPMELRSLIDQINSAWVSASLDIDHVATLGAPQDWIRLLGRRVTHLYASDAPADWKNIAGTLADCWCEGYIVCRGVQDAANHGSASASR